MGREQEQVGALIERPPYKVRIRKMDIFEIHFGRGEVVHTQPFAMRIGELRQMTLLNRLSMGYAKSPNQVTVNQPRIQYVIRSSVNAIQSDDWEADEDGNEVEVWDLAPWVIANKFQFCRTNHRDLEDDICGVSVFDVDPDGLEQMWQVKL